MYLFFLFSFSFFSFRKDGIRNNLFFSPSFVWEERATDICHEDGRGVLSRRIFKTSLPPLSSLPFSFPILLQGDEGEAFGSSYNISPFFSGCVCVKP